MLSYSAKLRLHYIIIKQIKKNVIFFSNLLVPKVIFDLNHNILRFK
jgi:hypothetical protein